MRRVVLTRHDGVLVHFMVRHVVAFWPINISNASDPARVALATSDGTLHQLKDTLDEVVAAVHGRR